jgi:cytochrome c1
VRSAKYRPAYRVLFWVFVVVCVGLGYLGAKPAEGGYVIASQIAASLSAAAFGLSAPASAAGPQEKPPRQSWSFAGMFGQFDQAQLQRGFQVYRESCQSCHSINRVSFRNLMEPGGPQFSEAQVRALAAEYEIDDINDSGEAVKRKGRPADRFPKIYPNEEAAKAAQGAVPPDLSVMAKARSYERGFPWFLIDMLPGFSYQEHGVDYISALLQGYTKEDDPKWNLYFPGNVIGMSKPLSAEQVDYTDGTPKTLEQYSRDVAAFLMWAAEPKMEERKKTGSKVMIFLFVFAGLLYFSKKKVWAQAH